LAETLILPNPENTVTLEDIPTLYQYRYGKDFTYYTPSGKSNCIWYTQYPARKGRSSQCFEIPAVWGGNKKISFPYRNHRDGF